MLGGHGEELGGVGAGVGPKTAKVATFKLLPGSLPAFGHRRRWHAVNAAMHEVHEVGELVDKGVVPRY